MTALAAGAIISGGLGIYKTIKGANQKSDAEELARNNKLTPQTIPSQIKQATNLAAQNYYNGMPGQQAAANAINQNGANQFYNGSQAASSGGDLLDLASKINVGQNMATNDLATRAAGYKQNALGGYQNALNTEGQYQDKIYNNNVLQPYLRTADAASAMYGAGEQNMYGGLDQIGTAGLGYASGVANQQKAVSAEQPFATFGETKGSPYIKQYNSQSGNGINYNSPSIAAQMAAASTKKGKY